MPRTIAVIGAGMAGASCARALADAGQKVTVFDKGRSVGGRLAQRRVDGLVYDHGAQYMAAGDLGFQAAIDGWAAAGLCAPWPGVGSGAGATAWIGVPAMSAPVKAMLAGLEVVTGARIVSIGRDARWWPTVDGGRRHGPFDRIAIAVPAPQAIELLGAQVDPGVSERLRGVTYAPCWACLVTFEAPLATRLGSGRVEHDVLAWIGDNRGKPGRGFAESWTLHATPTWSQANLERPADAVAAEMAKSFADLHREAARQHHLAAHRWRYSMVSEPLGEPCLVAGDLGLAGDWCLGARVEAAWLSGRALAQALMG